MGYVLKFIKNMKQSNVQKKPDSCQRLTVYLSEDEVQDGRKYFFKKTTAEVKHFNKQKSYEKFSVEREGVLWYTGRILPTNEFTITGRFTDAMKDLSQSTFCVPIIDKFSPVAYSIINDVHWHDKNVKHSGVESTWRQVLSIAYITEGRGIVKLIRKNCERCRYLNKKQIDVMMGPISPFNTTIAPAFYITQVDLAGPFLSYSSYHKRTTIKVWFAVFCCCTTSAVKIKLMEDYSSSAFIQAFIRFSS